MPQQYKNVKRGFTLIELLVVVAIIALLIALLIPSLAAARETAKTMKCAANMRSLGQIIVLFAAQNDGRGPGAATGVHGSIAWPDILSAEMFNASKSEGMGGRMGNVTDPRTLSCTNFTVAIPAGQSVRPWVYNEYAQAPSWLDPLYAGPNIVVDGTSEKDSYYDVPPRGGQPWTLLPLSSYNLGAKLQVFQPDQFMIYESFAGTDTGAVSTIDKQGRITDPLYPLSYTSTPWAPNGSGIYAPGAVPAGGSRDSIAFRHPFFRGTNVLHFDVHVDTLKPSDDVADNGKRQSHWAILP